MPKDQMKRGIVVEGRGSQVRVRFEDNDEVISPWLDVVSASTSGAKFYSRPKPGSMVVCNLDARRESGVVVGALYSDADPAPADSHSTFHAEMDDGSVFRYEGGILTFTHASGVVLTVANGKLVVDGNLEISGDLSVAGETTLKDTSINGVGQVGS